MIGIEKIALHHAEALYYFEVTNRSFFETMVPSRGDAYYEWTIFLKRLDSLLLEQERKEAYFYIIVDEGGSIVGRMNLVLDSAANTAELGFRIGRNFTGKGLAKQAVQLLLKEQHIAELERITAKTTSNHMASQKVLERSGFTYIRTDPDAFYFQGEMVKFVYYDKYL